MPARGARHRVASIAEVIGVAILAGWYFAGVFRWQTGEPLRLGLGDWIDPYFINFLLEHWYHSVTHVANPLALPIFYPSSHALGYSHSLILYAPFYIAVRPFLHPFLADTASLALVLVGGSTALYVIFRHVLRLSIVEALVTSGFFWTSSNAVFFATGIWEQRASIFLVPMIAVVAMAAMRGRPTVGRQALAGLAGFLAALLPAQDFYTGALTLVVVVLITPGFLAVGPIAAIREVRQAVRTERERERSMDAPRWTPPSPWWAIGGCVALLVWIVLTVHPIERIHIAGIPISAHDTTLAVRVAFVLLAYFAIRRWRLLAWSTRAVRVARSRWAWMDGRVTAAGVGAALGLTLFLVIYSASFLERRSFPSDQLLGSLKAFTGETWRHPGSLLSSNQAYPTMRGFGLVLMLAATTWILPIDGAQRWRRHVGWFLAASAIVLVIPYRFGDVTLWKMLAAPVPGFGAIRDPKRIIEPFELAIAVFAAFFLSQQRERRWARGLVVASMVGLAMLDWNQNTLPFVRDPASFDRVIRVPVTVDPGCRSFFIRPEPAAYRSRSDNGFSLYGVDASFLALYTGVPTLNGYSGWWPDEWRLSDAEDRNYMHDLDDWIQRNQLRGVCGLDLETRTMTPYVSGR